MTQPAPFTIDQVRVPGVERPPLVDARALVDDDGARLDEAGVALQGTEVERSRHGDPIERLGARRRDRDGHTRLALAHGAQDLAYARCVAKSVARDVDG